MKQRTIIDAHAHIYPDRLAQAVSASISSFYHLNVAIGGYPRLLLESGEQIGVKRYLISAPAARAHQVSELNDFIHERCKHNPAFLGLGTLHPKMRDYERELERIVQMGLHGIKLHPDLQEFEIDDRAMYPVYEKIRETGLPILFHTGDVRSDFAAPERLARMAEHFPDIPCIASHLGGYRCWDEARRVLAGLPNLYFDTSNSLSLLSKDEAGELITLFGPERVMFGTNFPMATHEQELNRLLALGLSHESEEMILHGTFEELFDLDMTSQRVG